jgi:hypothetical protein
MIPAIVFRSWFGSQVASHWKGTLITCSESRTRGQTNNNDIGNKANHLKSCKSQNTLSYLYVCYVNTTNLPWSSTSISTSVNKEGTTDTKSSTLEAVFNMKMLVGSLTASQKDTILGIDKFKLLGIVTGGLYKSSGL